MSELTRPRSPVPTPPLKPPGRTLYRPPLLEADFQDALIPFLIAHHFLVHHSRPARTADGYRTALQGQKGCPDLVLVRFEHVWLIELKRDTEKPDANQARWIAEAGPQHAAVWRPRDWPFIREWAKNPVEAVAA